MKKFIVLLSALFFPTGYFTLTGNDPAETPATDCQQLYTDMNLDGKVSYRAFEQAVEGYNTVTVKKKNIITLIDFTKPSTQERLFVFDVANRKLLISSLVAHGKASGENYATSFSNKNGSHKSSLGFYLTDFTYQGDNGYSLILNGLEKGINDNARQRSIVIHGADYCDPSYIETAGRLGRSFGCPALPYEVNDRIIDMIKGGTLLYIYANDNNYLARSPVLARSAVSAS